MTLDQIQLMGKCAQKQQLRDRIERVEDVSLGMADPKERKKILDKWIKTVSE